MGNNNVLKLDSFNRYRKSNFCLGGSINYPDLVAFFTTVRLGESFKLGGFSPNLRENGQLTTNLLV